MQIGTFTATADGYSGRIRTLTLDIAVRLSAAPAGGERSPDWRVSLDEEAGPIEVGAAWQHEGAKAGFYLTLQLDCPGLPRPIRANLVRSARDDATFILLWSPRPRRQKDA